MKTRELCLIMSMLAGCPFGLIGQQHEMEKKLTHEEQIAAWHQQRLNSLKRPHGWLSLVALDWLEEGDNQVAGFGTVTLNKNVLSFKSLPGIGTNMRGQVFTSGSLKTDSDKIELGSRAFVVIKRGDRYAIRMWDSNADALKAFAGIDRFPVSSNWMIEATWESYEPPKPVQVPSVIPGYSEDSVVPGIARFSVNGIEYSLEPVGEPGARQLFFIFADKTNGSDTYGAGRFLYTDPPKNGKVMIDFNKAINPPCAFSPYATCPLPLASNRLALRVEAGEKKFGDH